jgi:hypothetical protein
MALCRFIRTMHSESIALPWQYIWKVDMPHVSVYFRERDSSFSIVYVEQAQFNGIRYLGK